MKYIVTFKALWYNRGNFDAFGRKIEKVAQLRGIHTNFHDWSYTEKAFCIDSAKAADDIVSIAWIVNDTIDEIEFTWIINPL